MSPCIAIKARYIGLLRDVSQRIVYIWHPNLGPHLLRLGFVPEHIKDSWSRMRLHITVGWVNLYCAAMLKLRIEDLNQDITLKPTDVLV